MLFGKSRQNSSWWKVNRMSQISFEEFVMKLIGEQDEDKILNQTVGFVQNFLDHLSFNTSVHVCAMHGSVAASLMMKLINEGHMECAEAILGSIQEQMKIAKSQTKH